MARATIALLLATVFLTACGEGIRTLEGAAYGTTWTVKYVGDRSEPDVRDAVERELAAFDVVFSTYREDSEISRFNAHAGNDVFPCGPDLRRVVSLALDVARRTGGAFDPTIKPMRDVYDSWAAGAAQDPEAMEQARQRVGWGRLQVTDKGMRKAFPDLELDLDAIAKGAAVDHLGRTLTALGLEVWFVEIGGEISCRGTKPGDEPWQVGIADPGRPRAPLVVVPLRDAAMATSGSYLDHLEGERPWHHIFDPRTGRNAVNDVVSVSVTASDCALADALATAFMVLGPEGARPVVEHYADRGAGALLLLRDEDGNTRQEEVQWPW